MKTKQKSRQGFTLIELLVVIAIIGLLASVVLVALRSSRAKARDAVRKNDMDQLKKAVELYSDNTTGSFYPAPAGCASANGVDISALATPLAPFLQLIPNDPSGAGTTGYPNNFAYVCSSASNPIDFGLYIPFSLDGNLASCKFRTAGGVATWFASAPDCNY